MFLTFTTNGVASDFAARNVASFFARKQKSRKETITKKTFFPYCVVYKSHNSSLCAIGLFGLKLDLDTYWLYDLDKDTKSICTVISPYYTVPISKNHCEFVLRRFLEQCLVGIFYMLLVLPMVIFKQSLCFLDLAPPMSSILKFTNFQRFLQI